MATPLPASSALSLRPAVTLQHLPSCTTTHLAVSQSSTVARTGLVSGRRSRVLAVAKGESSSPMSVAEEEKASSSSGSEASPADDVSAVSTSQPARPFSPTACQACGKEEKVGVAMARAGSSEA